MKIINHLFIYFIGFLPLQAQSNVESFQDSLEAVLEKDIPDSSKIDIYNQLGFYYFQKENNGAKSLYYFQKGTELGKSAGNTKSYLNIKTWYAYHLSLVGNHPQSILLFDELVHESEQKDPTVLARTYAFLCMNYLELGENNKALEYARLAKEVFIKNSYEGQSKSVEYPAYPMFLAEVFTKLNIPDSALLYADIANKYQAEIDAKKQNPTFSFRIALVHGTLYYNIGKLDSALYYHRLAYEIAQEWNIEYAMQVCGVSLAQTEYSLNNKVDAAQHLLKVLSTAGKTKNYASIQQAAELLSKIYEEEKNIPNAYKYVRIAQQAKDSILNQKKYNALQTHLVNEATRNQSLLSLTEINRINNENKIKTDRLKGGIGTIALVALFGLYAYQRKKVLNEKISKQASDLEIKNKEIEKSLNLLKSTQAQLIQSEKMASLGELTAGIAHEIQNPLNFVNNFSEVNNELIDEIIEDRSKKIEDRSDKLQDELIVIIKENSEKINHHGKRAESIVKGMLEHSRKSTGIKEPTDINKLCDEFVRLSYHGLRAKDKNFNCDYKLNLDPYLPLVNVVSQDIGRVILNIINNAFQACSEKNRDTQNLAGSSGTQANSILQGYQPQVSITTKFVASLRLPTASLSGRQGQAGRCEICISDNGLGIPASIKDKIFQPFFTTKPTGQGTGLGLSLAYDIVKAHGGEIKVVSNENVARPDDPIGRGTEFIIQLPIL